MKKINLIKTLVTFSVMFFSLLSFYGCSKFHTPSCADESVKKTVLDISTDEYKRQFKEYLANKTIIELNCTFDIFKGSSSSYDFLIRLRDGREIFKGMREKINNSISYIDQQVAIAKPDIRLMNIRIDKIYKDIKKCECSGELQVDSENGKILPHLPWVPMERLLLNSEIPINYTAQTTEEGDTYVSVVGLK